MGRMITGNGEFDAMGHPPIKDGLDRVPEAC
jgi:hypothetical protein